MESIKFSVIVPVYNVEKYLKACIDSIIHQSFRSFEIILVDDGSTDQSGLLCDSYVKRYPQMVSVIHKQNEGLFSARRTGLKSAHGTYICFVDSDDMIREDTLEKIHTIIEKYHADMVVFGMKRIDGLGRILEKIDYIFEEGIIEKEYFFEKLLINEELNSLCTKVCKYTLFDVKRDYSSWYFISQGEDLLQSLPVINAAKKIYYLRESLYFYRKNFESITYTCQKERYYGLQIILPLVYDYMVRLGFNSQENISLFYRYCLSTLWACIYPYVQSGARQKECRSYLKKIYAFEFVKNARVYLKKMKCKNRREYIEKIALQLFYMRSWSLLVLFLRTVNTIINIRHSRVPRS